MREYQYPDGKVQKVDSIFYGFQKGSFLAHCMNESGSYESFYGYYKLKDDEISITLWPDNSSGNESVHEELVNSDSYKKFFGWGDSGERTFKVEELTNKKMRWTMKERNMFSVNIECYLRIDIVTNKK